MGQEKNLTTATGELGSKPLENLITAMAELPTKPLLKISSIFLCSAVISLVHYKIIFFYC